MLQDGDVITAIDFDLDIDGVVRTDHETNYEASWQRKFAPAAVFRHYE